MKLSHLVDAEYGNQGIDFKMVPREGFGWMNCELACIYCHKLSLIILLAQLPIKLVFPFSLRTCDAPLPLARALRSSLVLESVESVEILLSKQQPFRPAWPRNGGFGHLVLL